jgi:hypothetical protein
MAALRRLLNTSLNDPTLRPKRFELFIGGYLGTSYSIRMEGATLIYQVSYCRDDRHEPPIACVPTDAEWRDFWKVIEKTGAWGWKPRYYQPACDGTNWDIDIIYGDMTLNSSGSNGYPPSGENTVSREFGTFCGAVSRLVGGRNFG